MSNTAELLEEIEKYQMGILLVLYETRAKEERARFSDLLKLSQVEYNARLVMCKEFNEEEKET